MPHPIWTTDRPAALDAWTGIPDQLRALIGPDDDRAALAATVGQLRVAGLNVTDPAVFALAVQASREQDDTPALPGLRLYRPGQYERRRRVEPVVYYARIGNRVKIGTTIDLKQRMSSLNPEQLLATEPGGPQLEAQRHGEFAQLRTHGEWFRLEDPLTGHIAALAQP